MKVLIHNYSSEISTEPIALAKVLSKVCSLTLWPAGISAFDVFDAIEPDVFICKAMRLNQEMVKRASSSNCKIVINCEGLTTEQLPEVDRIIKNNFKYANTGTMPIHTKLCFDPFIVENNQKTPTYRAHFMSLVGKKPENRFLRKGSSHIVSYSEDYKEADIHVPIHFLANLYDKYNKLGIDTMSQIAYDAAYYGGSCYVFDENKTITEKELVNNSPYDLAMDIFEGLGEKDIVEKIKECKDGHLNRK